jgi:hypothetical protein
MWYLLSVEEDVQVVQSVEDIGRWLVEVGGGVGVKRA